MNQHKGTGHLGTEPKFFNETTDRPFGKLFVIMNESYEKDGVKHETTIPVNILLPRKSDVEKAKDFHTGTGVSWTGKLAHRTYEVDGKERSSYELVIAGPGAKLELLEAKPKDAAADLKSENGRRQQQASAPAHNQA